MATTTDNELTESIASDPFHKGLEEHGEFLGFKQEPMSDEAIEESRSKLSRLTINGRLGLVLAYIGILGLMAKTYA